MVFHLRSNIQVTQYFHFVAFRDTMKYVPFKGHSLFTVLWHFSERLRNDSQNNLNIQPSDFSHLASGWTTNLPRMLSSSTMNQSKRDPFLLVALISLPMTPKQLNYRIASLSHGASYQLHDIECDHPPLLSKGCHSFVKCYGEPFIRCSLASFESGLGAGYSLLAHTSKVLVCGDIEVSESGVLSRWVIKAGSHHLPLHMLRRFGLPLNLGWSSVSTRSVASLDRAVRNNLIKKALLLNIQQTRFTKSSKRKRKCNRNDVWIIKADQIERATCSPTILFYEQLSLIQHIDIFRMLCDWLRRCEGGHRVRVDVSLLDPVGLETALSKAKDVQTYYDVQFYVGDDIENDLDRLQWKMQGSGGIVGIIAEEVEEEETEDEEYDEEEEEDGFFEHRQIIPIVSVLTPYERGSERNEYSTMLFNWSEDYEEEERTRLETIEEMRQHMQLVGCLKG